MATKRRSKAKTKAGRGRRGRGGAGRGRRALTLLGVLLLLAGAAAAGWLLTRQQAEVPVKAVLLRSAGGSGLAPGALNSPRGLGVAPNGDVYVADLGNGRVSAYGKDGSFKLVFGKLGPEPGKAKQGQFNEPSGLAVGPDGSVYVADTWNQRIQKFDAKGKYLSEIDDGFYSPRNVAVDRAGNIYVADTGHSQVKVLDPSGHEIKVLGGPGGGGGEFREVFGIAINSMGEIYVADPGNRRIEKFSALPACQYVKSVKVAGWKGPEPFWPMLAVDKQDMVYAVDGNNHKVWIYDSVLAYRGTLGGNDAAEFLSAPLGIGFAPDGSLWLSDKDANKLIELGAPAVPAPAR
ncbi:MAG TPA: NHL repeat-containing protein [bacterium]|jgi:DNA-binding beta-propeller fold protein YncE|nr:NHL repeat-containing protein [bacterium]